MRDIAWVAVGGMVGTLARVAIASSIPVGVGSWPWSTLVVNTAGSLLLALLLGLLVHACGPELARALRLGLGVGLLGSFTTYSAFVAEAYQISADLGPVWAFGYLALSSTLGLAAAMCGFAIGSSHRQGSQ